MSISHKSIGFRDILAYDILSILLAFVFNNILGPTFIFKFFLCAGFRLDFHGQIGNPLPPQ